MARGFAAVVAVRGFAAAVAVRGLTTAVVVRGFSRADRSSDHPVTPSSSAAAVVSLIVAMVMFQAGASIAKHLIPLVGAPGTTALRLGISALTMALIQRPWRQIPSRSALPVVVAFGLSLGTMNFVFYMALRTIPLGIAVGLEFLGPLAVALASSRHRLDIVWIALAAIGLFLLLPVTRASAHLDPVGVVFALGAGASWQCTSCLDSAPAAHTVRARRPGE